MEDPHYISACCKTEEPGSWPLPTSLLHFNASQALLADKNIGLTGNDEVTTSCPCLPSNQTRSNGTADGMFPPAYLFAYVTVASAIIFLGGVFGNVLVILGVVRMRSMRTRMNYFLVNLSVADLLVLVVCQPVALLDLYAKERWLLGAALCKLVPFLENTAVHCSALCLLAISAERYVAVCRPFLATRQRDTHLLTIPLVWTVSTVLCLPFAFMSNLEQVPYNDGTQQWMCRTKTDERIARMFLLLDFALCLLLPLLLITFFYTAIVMTLATHCCNKPAKSPPLHTRTPGCEDFRAESRRQVVKMLVTVVVFFYVCLLPLRTISIWLVFDSPSNVEKLGFHGYLNLLNAARILMFINSAGNPLIYGLMSTKFRSAFATALPLSWLQGRWSSSSVSVMSARLQNTRV